MSSGTVSSVRIFDQSSLGAKALMVLAASVALAISTQIKVPFWPVPMTMQTFVVLMIGLHFGPRLAVASVLAYLAEGMAGQYVLGWQVFASASGLAGPTGGYLVGFLIAAATLSLAVQRGYANSVSGLLGVLLTAEIIIFALGFAWLSTFIGIAPAFFGGVVNFLLAEALKIGLAIAASRAISKTL